MSQQSAPTWSIVTGIEELAEQQLVPDYHRDKFNILSIVQVPYRNIVIANGKTSRKVYFGSRSTAAGPVSILNANTGAAYGAVSGAAKIILIIQGNATTLTDFEIFSGDSPNAATDQLEDFPSVSLGATNYVTSKLLTLASGKYLTVRPNSGTIGSVTGYIIE